MMDRTTATDGAGPAVSSLSESAQVQQSAIGPQSPRPQSEPDRLHECRCVECAHLRHLGGYPRYVATSPGCPVDTRRLSRWAECPDQLVTVPPCPGVLTEPGNPARITTLHYCAHYRPAGRVDRGAGR